MKLLQRLLRPVHRWIGLIAGLYFLLIALTGGALLFRIDLQRALDPGLFTPVAQGPLADPVAVIGELQQTYPRGEVAGIDAPTSRRPTTLAYVQQDRRFITVLLDPASGRILGELPQRKIIRLLHSLHFELTLGRAGRIINGVGALLLTVMGLSGVILWWRGRRWREGLKVRRGQPALTTHHELHNAVGIWAALALLMWGITGAAFIFPQTAIAAIGWFSPVEAAEPPHLLPPPAGQPPLSLAQQVAAAVAARPGRKVARIVLPGHARVPLHVQFARSSPTRMGEQLESVYVDPWRGAVMQDTSPRSAGQAVWDSFTLLHTAGFGGYGVRTLWLLFALTPMLLLVTGTSVWWLRRFRS